MKREINRILQFFVTAKHWQVFLIAVGPFFVAAALGMIQVWSGQESLVVYRLASIPLSVIVIASSLLWMWSYISFLRSVTPAANRLKLRYFAIAAIFVVTYFAVSGVVPVSKWDRLLPFDFLTMLCALYAAFFLARVLVRAETGNSGTFSNRVLTFLLLWLWPIGIWFIQPRINRIFAEYVSGTCEQSS